MPNFCRTLSPMDGRPLPPGRRAKRLPLKKTETKNADVIEIHDVEESSHIDLNETLGTQEQLSPAPVVVTTADAGQMPFDVKSAESQVEYLSVEPRVSETKEADAVVESADAVEPAPLPSTKTDDVAPIHGRPHVNNDEPHAPAQECHPEVDAPKAISVEDHDDANARLETTSDDAPEVVLVPDSACNSSGGVDTSDASVERYGLEKLLRPLSSVPELAPLEALECVYNDEASMLQKQILRAVKWCTQKDKFKLEEFKINSRLYGNGFMEPQEYVESMAAELGPLHMLVVVPCMLRLQPDLQQKESLYVALQAYRARRLDALEKLL
ncbi:Aste57867_24502 [Aphanomyces stellatus]|uniref:Aste57867_24502 protein n=1 Tax=Aphanomyces stellatus TaxID=120398 RepID=A0A485LRA2_9STRA|nr:hypothetical protein As57867_024425 [Aphanomyces stellatus]VFU01141.1 Aste57867_24502 [Aphanomyces stellatus]